MSEKNKRETKQVLADMRELLIDAFENAHTKQHMSRDADVVAMNIKAMAQAAEAFLKVDEKLETLEKSKISKRPI